MAENEKKKPEPVSDRISPVYGILRVLAKIVFHTVMPVKCHNREQLDAEAPYVLIANHHSEEEIGKIIGADSIGFLDIKDLKKLTGDKDLPLCDGCFSGFYPVQPPESQAKYTFEIPLRK